MRKASCHFLFHGNPGFIDGKRTIVQLQFVSVEKIIILNYLGFYEGDGNEESINTGR